MTITSITVSAARTIPVGQGFVKPMVSLTASLEAGESVDVAVAELQLKAERLLDEHAKAAEVRVGYFVRDEQVINPEDIKGMGHAVNLRECGRRHAVALGEEPQVHPDYSKG